MTEREQLYEIVRDLKWIIIISLLISALLYFPDQVRELYRISATEDGHVALTQFIALIAIASLIWFGALHVTTETLLMRGPFSKTSQPILHLFPTALGTLPLLAAAIAQLSSRPKRLSSVADKLGLTDDLTTLYEVGSVFRIQENALEGDAATLCWYSVAFLIISLLFAVVTWSLGNILRASSTKININYFRKWHFLAITFVLIIVLTVTFIFNPVRFPQFLGPFGILAAFTLCIVTFCIHLSLLTIKHQIPFIPIVLFLCLLIAASDVNDNHFIRTLSEKDLRLHNSPPPTPRLAAGDAFVQWLKQPDRLNYVSSQSSKNSAEYPVFVLSAQGGGIYAAYNAAIFLARIQDLCPEFRRHLFAISSVSGGSIGAATFAAALDADDRATDVPSSADRRLSDGPCPRIAEFLSNAHARDDLDKAGPIETKVDTALSSDFLSPLVAASLFLDFTQSFVPHPIPILDRARALEYTLENAADKMYARSTKGTGTPNLLKSDYQHHWAVEKSLPALLMNATDTGSGKRVLISPFDLNKRNPKDSDICILAAISHNSKNADGDVQSASIPFPLSTAAFISARFPWVTPAATVANTNPCITREDKARLVDGGYVDNSGVETALNLIEEIKASANQIQEADPHAIPRFRIYLISLASGEFPDHGSFSFNELVEPFRALLSGRESRAYIALNRAALQVKVIPKSDSSAHELPTYSRANLKNFFYNLPLGWAMSDKTRDVIALDSGRYWDCKPDSSFSQSRKHLSNSDCMQLQIYHLLNNSTATALKDQQQAQKIAARVRGKVGGEGKTPPRPDHEALLACYEKSWLQDRDLKSWTTQSERRQTGFAENGAPELLPYKRRYLSYHQSEHVRELLREWDKQPETDSGVLSYILGSISYDSNDFRRTTENLSLNSEAQIKAVWGIRIDAINRKRKQENPNASDVDLIKLLNNPPALANLVWGSPYNVFGNNPMNSDGTFDPKKANDGWTYRPRGVYQIVGREQFLSHSTWLNRLYPDLQINIIEEPDAVWNRTISAKVAYAHFHFQRYQGETLIQRLKKAPADWRGIRTMQADMGSENPAEVGERSAMFQKCIEVAPLRLHALR